MEIVWFERAVEELLEIQAYIELDDPSAARAVRIKIDETIGLLADQPSLGRAGRVFGTRELVIPGTPYIVAYKVIARRIVIVTVLHGARRWPKQL
jgi:toxin ParE1/3/4